MVFHIIILISLCCSFSVWGEDVQAKIKGPLYAEINSPALKALIDSEVPIVILDARPVFSPKDKRIPKSVPMRPDASLDQISKVIPSKSSLIIVYCDDIRCVDDADLATYLISLGYKNVIEYSTGIKSWISLNYPVEDIK